jgi:putative hemolysin
MNTTKRFERFGYGAVALMTAALTAAACASQAGDATPAASGTSALGSATGAAQGYQLATVQAPAGAVCALHPEGSTLDGSIPVGVEDDGVARFLAVRATAGSAVSHLTLDCTDLEGATSSYTVDLTSDATFASRPFDIERAGGVDRPALSGDPMTYSSQELIEQGYGPRPDPTQSPSAYARWLAAASKPVHFARGAGTAAQAAASIKPMFKPKPMGITTDYNTTWTGSMTSGYYGASPKLANLPASAGTGAYALTEATFTVPAVTLGGDNLGNTAVHAAIWNGLMGDDIALIQGGIQVGANATSAGYIVFREYCCGDSTPGAGNDYTVPFTPVPGHQIYSQQWYCNASGEVDVNGGYGCSYVEDETSGIALSCTSPSSTTCASVPANTGWTFGQSAEYITEAQPTYPDFAAPYDIVGSAEITFGSGSSSSLWTDIGTDPTVTHWQVQSSTGAQLTASLIDPNDTHFASSCVPETAATACNGAVCGTASNGCGGTVACGECAGATPYCVGGGCVRCLAEGCPTAEHWNPETCSCEGCACGTLVVDGKTLCNVCK